MKPGELPPSRLPLDQVFAQRENNPETDGVVSCVWHRNARSKHEMEHDASHATLEPWRDSQDAPPAGGGTKGKYGR